MNTNMHATAGDPAWAAYRMVQYCGSSREWADAIKTKRTD